MDAISEFLNNRLEFLQYLQSDIAKNNESLSSATSEIHSLEQTIENLKTLGAYPEHVSLIPMGANIYLPGRLVHTGEFYVSKTVGSETYTMLNSLERTVSSLDRRISEQKELIEKLEGLKIQLGKRVEVLEGESSATDIRSDKGVAVKVGDYYEILEFEEN